MLPRAKRLSLGNSGVWVGSVLLLVLATISSAWVMTRPHQNRVDWEEWQVAQHILDRSRPIPPIFTLAEEREMSTFIDGLPDGTTVLMDSFLAFPVNVFSRKHDRFAITSDRDFPELLQNPFGKVTHVLVPTSACPPGSACMAEADQVARTYPELRGAGAPWATPVLELEGVNRWRLYVITPP
jgi:hypothetical protein